MTTPTDTAALAAIDAATRELHLPGIRDHAGRLAAERNAPGPPLSGSAPTRSASSSTTGRSDAGPDASTKPASPA